VKQLITTVIILLLVASCTESDYITDDVASVVSGSGVFIVNEGNFRAGNGSLSWFSYDSVKISNDIFRKITKRPLGDVPNEMVVGGNRGYIVVNNSGKIEVVNANTLKSVTTISDLNSPRNIALISSDKAYITSMYSDSVTILNLKKNIVSGFINIRRTSEAIVLAGTKAFVANWFGGSEVMVINTLNDRVIDSISVGNEPESMELDRNNMLWVLCNGGWMREYFAELDCINTNTFRVQKRLIFPSKQDSPSCLKISPSRDTLYYLEKGVRKLSIDDNLLPAITFISEGDHIFYKMGINPLNGEVIVTDAVDYQQNGFILRYKRKGIFISTIQAGIIPGSICFKVKPDLQTEWR